MVDKDYVDYNSEYYESNKKAISEQRKNKYKEDKEYREKCKDRALKRYKDTYKRKRKRIPKPKRQEKQLLNTKVGTRVFYTIGEFAYRIDRSTHTINSWLIKGILPPHYATPKGPNRWFSARFIDMVGGVVEKFNQQRISDIVALKDELHETYYNWLKKGGDGL